MVTPTEAIQFLNKDKQFVVWKKNHQNSFLAHCFRMFDEANSDEMHLGFSIDNDKMTTFVVSKDSVTIMDESEVFKHPDSKILPLIPADILIDDIKAISIAKEFIKKQYPKEILAKEIMLLQNLEIGQVYNLTFLTMAMNTLNVKIDSKTGEVKQHELKSIMDFKIDS